MQYLRFLALWLTVVLCLVHACLAVPLSSPSSFEHTVAGTGAVASTPFAMRPFAYLSTALSSLLAHPLLEPCLVQTCADCQPYWTTEMGKHWLFFRGVHFIDLTGDVAHPTALQNGGVGRPANAKLPKRVAYRKELESVFETISDAGPREDLAKFTSFRTRYYRSAEGRQSQAWLKAKATSLAESRPDLGIEVSEWPHSWGQNSIILHIPGVNKTASEREGVTVVGAHQDSAGMLPFLSAPGADDDGSGTVTLLEALRALLAAPSWRPETDVEFHWYSAEEGGLLGSQEVVRGYADRQAKVKAMLQQDMTAFVKAGTEERVGLPTDFVDEELRLFVQRLIREYLDIPAVDTKLGYAASDHASWNKAGYRSVFAIEAPFEDCNLQRIHTTRDTFDHEEFSFSHLLKFVRLTSAFVVELSGWSKAK